MPELFSLSTHIVCNNIITSSITGKKDDSLGMAMLTELNKETYGKLLHQRE